MSEAVGGVGWCDLVEDGLHRVPERGLCSAGQAAQELFDLGEDHLDGVHVGRVGWLEQQRRAARLDRGANFDSFVARQIVHHNDVAGLERRREHLLDERCEHVGVDRAVNDRGAAHTVHVERPDQRRGLPVSVRGVRDETIPDGSASTQARHVRFRPRFVNEDELRRIDARSPQDPLGAALHDVWSMLFRGVESLFL